MTRWLGWSMLAAGVIAGGYLAALNPEAVDLVVAPGRVVRVPLGVVLTGAMAAGGATIGAAAALTGLRFAWRQLIARWERRRQDREDRRIEVGPDELLEHGDPAAAVAAAERVLAERPESPWLLRRLRDAYARGERWTDALAVTERLVVRLRTPEVLEAELASLRALRLQVALGDADHRRAARTLQALAREAPQVEAAWLGAGDRWLEAGHRTRARRAWVRGTRHRPALPLLARIEAFDATDGRPGRTARLYRRLRHRHPDDPTLRLAFARYLLRTGAPADAAALLEAPLAIPAADALRGEAARQRGDFEGAAACLARALGPALGVGDGWTCVACGAGAAGWAPRCPACRRWSTLHPRAAPPGDTAQDSRG